MQVVSPLVFWKREKRDTKRIQAVSPWRILFWQRQKGMKKMNSTLLFSRFRRSENFRKLLTKEEEEEIQEDVQRDSRVVKD